MAITMTATLMRRISMRLIACLVLANFDAAAGLALGPKYPPLSDYMMAQEAEVALARSAAPEKVSAHATVKILTTSGYKVAAQGDNGFVCIVMRGWAAAISTTARERDLAYDTKVRAPHCFDPVASRTVLPLQELQAKLGMEGKGPDQLAFSVCRLNFFGDLIRSLALHSELGLQFLKRQHGSRRDRVEAMGRAEFCIVGHVAFPRGGRYRRSPPAHDYAHEPVVALGSDLVS